jgi:hypothetical protein
MTSMDITNSTGVTSSLQTTTLNLPGALIVSVTLDFFSMIVSVAMIVFNNRVSKGAEAPGRLLSFDL